MRCSLALIAGCGLSLLFGCSGENHSNAAQERGEGVKQPIDGAQPHERHKIAQETSPEIVIERGVTIATNSGSVHLANGIKLNGPQGQAIFDTQSGKLAYAAYTCAHADCPGNQPGRGPHCFAHPVPADRVDEQGYAILRHDVKRAVLNVRCPECRRYDGIVYYHLPEVAAKRATLDAEMADSIAAIRAAGGQLPPGVRPPMEIMRERAMQPRLYLVPE